MKTKTILQILVIFAVALASFSCSLLSKKYEKHETVEYNINAVGKTKLKLDNISGHINVYKSDSVKGLVIKAEKIGQVKKKDLDKPLDNIKVDVDTSGSVITVTSHIEKDKSWIHFDIHGGNEINYDIQIPPWLLFSVDGVTGDISIGSIPNETDINLVNGNITFDNLIGNQSISVTNGNIKGTIDSVKHLKMDVINGKITMNINKAYNGEIRADVVNGRISYDSLNISDVMVDKNSLHGYIGSRNNEISINVVNGKISLTGK